MNIDKELIDRALELKPPDKIFLIEALVESLDKSDRYNSGNMVKRGSGQITSPS
jgi:hypothetical protein